MSATRIAPMLATTGDLPSGDGWAYEFKWDGIRGLVDVGQGAVQVTSRSGRDLSAAFPELAGIAGQVPDALLDGELVSLDTAGRASFGQVIERMHASDPAQVGRLRRAVPATYLIFDLLRLEGVDTRDLTYADRRRLLEQLELSGPAWQTPDYQTDGEVAMAVALENGLEGVVAKRLDSRYHATRGHDWVKVKPEYQLDVVVGGWRRHRRELGSLLVGEPTRSGGLRFRGRVGGGVSARTATELLDLLRPLATDASPFKAGITTDDARGTTWVRPELVVEVDYGSITPDGRLRFPRLRRIRPDLSPAEVRR